MNPSIIKRRIYLIFLGVKQRNKQEYSKIGVIDMRNEKINFNDIVELLKEDVNLNIYELTFKLGCSDGLIYRRIVAEGFKGLIPLKNAIREGRL
ncbi:hypothetical protein DSECCO2_359910 [anaerobic digester metagenome]